MPPRSNLALKPKQERLPLFDFQGRRLKLVQSDPSVLPDEPSPMMEAIRRYLDALP